MNIKVFKLCQYFMTKSDFKSMSIYFVSCPIAVGSIIAIISVLLGELHCVSSDALLQPKKTVDIIPEELLDNRLKGGTPTDIKTFPFVVSIQKYSIPRCVGSLITESFLITAAHCLVDMNRKKMFLLDPVDFIIVSGRTNIKPETTKGQERRAKLFIIHSRFERPSLKYDVGVVETEVPFILGPTKLYTMAPGVIAFIHSCTLISWDTGKHSFDDYETPELNPNSMKLETIQMKVMGSAKCYEILDRLISMDAVCTSLHEQCPGQSGSPLICGESLYGIFTWTAGCKNSSFPAVFVMIAKISKWANNVIGGKYVESIVRTSSYAMEMESTVRLICFLHFVRKFSVF